MKKSHKHLIIGIVVVAAAGLAYYYWKQSQPATTALPAATPAK